jgi:Cof subfamily protein (haloacid dehalogenase superfamily)
MIKCIASDMDGTLLTATQEITAENRDAIKKAQALGVEVIIATGRSYQEARFALDEAEIKCPIICVNGAEVRTAEGKIVSSNPLDKGVAKQVSDVLTKTGNIYYEVYTNEGTFTTDAEKAVSIMVDIVLSANPEHNPEEVLQIAKKRESEGLFQTIKSYDELFEDDRYEIYKLLAFSWESDKLAAAQESLSEIYGIAVSSSGHENLEITSETAQKGIALEAFVNQRNISLLETMAIGDNFNDVSMFKRVGRSVAMENAIEAIKEQCDFVTASNEESGVAKAILEVLRA